MVININSGMAALNSLQHFAGSGYGGLYSQSNTNGKKIISNNIHSINQSTLINYYAATSALQNPEIARQMMEAQGIGEKKAAAHPAGTPPWDDTTEAKENIEKSDQEKLQGLLSRNKLLDDDEELDSGKSQKSEAKNLFSLAETIDD